MTNPLPKALAFDLDDTLYHESDYVAACLRNVAEHTPDPARALAIMVGAKDPFATLIETWPGCGLTLSTFLSIYRSTAPDALPLRPDARELLETLAAEHPHVPLFLITDGRSTGQRNKIAALGLDKYFPAEHIIISGETGHDKTTPVPFQLAMERLGEPHAWTYVGDNPAKDFRWPRALGWHTVMLLSPAGTTVHPQTLPADPAFAPHRTITDLREL